MLLTIAAILLLLWLFGLLFSVGGHLLYILLVVALIIFIYDMLIGRRPRY